MINLIALAVPFFLILIGVELLVARAKKRSVYRFADALADIGCGITQQVTVVFYGAVLLAGYDYVQSNWRLVTLPVWAGWVLAFVGVDFLYYWWHRASHEVNFLWAAHVVHHQSEDYNLAVALRQSATTSLTGWFFYIPLAFLGVPVLPFAVANSLSTLYQFWIHTELVPPLGKWEHVFNTPSLHRVHHAINPQYLDKNHAATFTFWDKLFGTFKLEKEECVYGITRPLKSFNPIWAQFAGYVDLVRLAWRAPSLGQALQTFVRSPAWHPEWMGEKLSPVTSRADQTKFEVAPSRRAQQYAFFWFVALVAGTFSLLMWGGSLDTAQTVIVASLIYLTLLMVSGMLEGRRWVRALEPVRLVAIAGAAAFFVLTPKPAPAPMPATNPRAAIEAPQGERIVAAD